jgi:hypothetical protein
MHVLAVYLLLVANGGPPIGAFTDAGACARAAAGLTSDMKKKDRSLFGKTLYECKPIEVVRYEGEPAPKWERK